jgi:hypothetical protein
VTSIDLPLDADKVNVRSATNDAPGGNLNLLIVSEAVNNGLGVQYVYKKANLHFNKNNNSLHCPGDIVAFFSSDERLKDNISKIEDPLAKVVSLGGYTFDWNENTVNEGSETGVIAQEVESLGLPGIVTTRDNGYKAVRYEKLVPLLIEAIKELNDKVSSLEDKLNN